MFSEPRSYSTFIGADKQDTGYATGKEKPMDPTLSEGTPSLDENWNGHETLNLNQAVVQPKLTEKGKAYRLFERTKD